MSDDIKAKQKVLRNILKDAGRLAIAFSGGVDSTYLLYEAHYVLGDNCLAVTAFSEVVSEDELYEAKAFCEGLHINHKICHTNEMELDEFYHNSPKRCYFCKHEIFSQIKSIAEKDGINIICDGSNVDDEGDYRPGLEALKELEIRSPLREAGMTKDDIRALSKEAGLPTWNKPAFACFASRIPYGEDITVKKLNMVSEAEKFLKSKGFTQLRVRIHNDLARIELTQEEFNRMLECDLRNESYEFFRGLGFSYTTLDLKGYRQGSMNEVLAKE